MPLAALGGRADVLDLLAPARPGLPGGHAEREPARRRGRHRDAAARDARGLRARRPRRRMPWPRALHDALDAEGVAHVIPRAGSLFSLAFRAEPVRDYADAQAQEAWRYPPFFHAMLDAGVSLPPSVFEAWFLSAAHDDRVIDRIVRRSSRRRAGARRSHGLRPDADYVVGRGRRFPRKSRSRRGNRRYRVLLRGRRGVEVVWFLGPQKPEDYVRGGDRCVVGVDVEGDALERPGLGRVRGDDPVFLLRRGGEEMAAETRAPEPIERDGPGSLRRERPERDPLIRPDRRRVRGTDRIALLQRGGVEVARVLRTPEAVDRDRPRRGR